MSHAHSLSFIQKLYLFRNLLSNSRRSSSNPALSFFLTANTLPSGRCSRFLNLAPVSLSSAFLWDSSTSQEPSLSELRCCRLPPTPVSLSSAFLWDLSPELSLSELRCWLLPPAPVSLSSASLAMGILLSQR